MIRLDAKIALTKNPQRQCGIAVRFSVDTLRPKLLFSLPVPGMPYARCTERILEEQEPQSSFLQNQFPGYLTSSLATTEAEPSVARTK